MYQWIFFTVCAACLSFIIGLLLQIVIFKYKVNVIEDSIVRIIDHYLNRKD